MKTDRLKLSPQILRLVCKTCGKPCRSKEEQEMHSKRNPGHVEYVDETTKQGEISYKPGDQPAAKPVGGGKLKFEHAPKS